MYMVLHSLISSAGEEYTHISTNVTFNASTSTQTVKIPILNNEVVAGSTMFSVSLTTADPAAILNPASTDITIEDDDSEQLQYILILIALLLRQNACHLHFFFLLQRSQLDSMELIQYVRMLESLVFLYLS